MIFKRNFYVGIDAVSKFWEFLRVRMKNNCYSIKEKVIERLRSAPKIKAISFDVYDTVILRNVSQPKDIFHLVEAELEAQYPNNSFFQKRSIAEKKARHGKEEVTLEDIYANLTYDYEAKEVFKAKEIELELKYAVFNTEYNDLFSELNRRNINYFFISDMYLPPEVIERILQNCGVCGYQKIYVSSDYGVRKRNTKLFRLFLKDNSLSPQQVMHVGDDLKADFVAPGLLGINAILYKKEDLFGNFYLAKKNNLKSSIIHSVIKNNANSCRNFFYGVGYAYFGPILLAYCQWLLKKTSSDRVDTLYFIARDGYVIQKAINILYPNRKKDKYLYISKKSNFGFRLNHNFSAQNVIDALDIKKGMTVKQLMRKMQLKDNIDIPMDTIITPEKIIKDYAHEFEKVIFLNKDRFEREATNFKRYIMQECENVYHSSNIGIVDVGWNGTIQKSIECVLGSQVSVRGYYLGLNNIKYSGNIKAVPFFNPRNEKERTLLRINRGVLEMFFNAPHGTTVGYYDENGIYYPKLLQNEKWYLKDKNNFKVLELLHAGALDFVKKVNELHLQGFGEDSDITYDIHMLQSINNINKKNLDRLGNVISNEDGRRYLAKPDQLLAYLFSPKKFLNDFADSIWKVGFIRRLFGGIKIPYGLIFRILVKCFNVKE